VKAFLDTSVLVPVFLADHEHHAASLDVFLRFTKRQSCCAVHSLAELYATVTRLPGRHRVSAEQAMLFLGEVRNRLTLVALDQEEYYATIEHAAATGVVGGTIYDALVGSCAGKAKAKTLYTWNLRHFEKFDGVGRVKTP
jgi:predicted nucleic acid-binding protein